MPLGRATGLRYIPEAESVRAFGYRIRSAAGVKKSYARIRASATVSRILVDSGIDSLGWMLRSKPEETEEKT